MFESLFDLPAHVFFVHLPAVAAPTASAATLIVGARPSWRQRYGWWMLGLAAVALVGTILAYESGEAFAKLLDGLVDISPHQDLAKTMRILALGHFLVVAGVVIHAKRSVGRDGQELPGWLLTGLAMVLAVLLAVWTIRTGHEGARITWSGVVPG